MMLEIVLIILLFGLKGLNMYISHKSNVIQHISDAEWDCRRLSKGISLSVKRELRATTPENC